MSEITISNTDWSIIQDLRSALAAATFLGQPLFEHVAVTTCPRQARQAQLAGSGPRAVVRYTGTHEAPPGEGVVGCTVAVELLLAVKAGSDESVRLEQALRLVNAARNAIEASPPAASKYWGDRTHWLARLAWSPALIDTAERPPWALASLPLAVAYTLSGPTGH
jgi:hypothetical protein